MTKHKYVEIIEEVDSFLDIPQMIRVNVESEEEAQQLFESNKTKFKKCKARLVEGEHFEDASKNKPCKITEIKNKDL